MIETIAIGNAPDDQLEVTVRGKTDKVIHMLIHGLSREALEQLGAALQTEIDKRHNEAQSASTSNA